MAAAIGAGLAVGRAAMSRAEQIRALHACSRIEIDGNEGWPRSSRSQSMSHSDQGQPGVIKRLWRPFG